MDGALARRLGTGDAVVIGLGSMIGAGVFSAFAPGGRGGRQRRCSSGSRSRRASPTATPSRPRSSPRSTRPPAARTSTGASGSASGGASSPGWGFVVGKTASCAAMALTFASYAVPRLDVGAAARRASPRSSLLTARELPRHHAHGRSDARCSSRPRCSHCSWSWRRSSRRRSVAPRAWAASTAGAYGVLQSAGLLFFAFAGYARIATLGEEVRDPERTIPRAIPLALGIAVAIYAVVGRRVPARGRARGARCEHSAARDRGRGGRRGLGAAGRARRRGGREPGRAARADRGHRAHHAGDGAQRRPAALARRGRTRATACRDAPSSPSAPSSRCSC